MKKNLFVIFLMSITASSSCFSANWFYETGRTTPTRFTVFSQTNNTGTGEVRSGCLTLYIVAAAEVTRLQQPASPVRRSPGMAIDPQRKTPTRQNTSSSN